MGRLEVEIRHGHHGGGPAQWGAVIALIVLVLFAAAGHREITAMIHDIVMIAEIILFSLIGLSLLAVAGITAVHVRAARRDRARRAPAVPVTPDYRVYVEPAAPARPALGTPRRQPSQSWPLPGDWDEIPRDGDDRRRYS